ncbi:MAG: APC family permease [Candidatus Melainabacteria bacterium]|nr:APC family permease [Candidatus Melainabacteria bacterium]
MTTTDSETLSKADQLKVEITPFSAWMVGVGCLIGSMAWLIHPAMLARGGVIATLVAWVIAALVTLPLALILMELSSMFPSAGGPYVYKYYALKRLIPHEGELVGFLCGWLFWISNTVGLACIANGVCNLASLLLYGGAQLSPIWFGPLIIICFFSLITLLNLLPAGKATRLNDVFTIIKLLMAIGFVGLVCIKAQQPVQTFLLNAELKSFTIDSLITKLASISMLALAGYSFIEATGCISYETKDARHAVPRALILTLGTVTVIYIAIALAIAAGAVLALSPEGATMLVAGTNLEANCSGVTSYLAGSLWGQTFVWLVILSIFACGFAAVMGLARVSYSMAQTKLFPAQFARLDHKTGVPRYALNFQLVCLLTIALGSNLLTKTGAISDAYTFLVETFGFMYAFVAMFYGVCVVSLRYTDPEMLRPFKIGKKGNTLVICLAIFVIAIWGYSALFCVNWKHQLAGLLAWLCGIPIFKYYRRGDSL